MKVYQASSYNGISTDKYPSFDKLDDMITWAVSLGATHISLSNYHGGGFWKAWYPERKRSFMEIMHFGSRYDYDGNPEVTRGKFTHLRNAGWFSMGEWHMSGHTHDTEVNGIGMYPMFPIMYRENDWINNYLENMRIANDYPLVIGREFLKLEE